MSIKEITVRRAKEENYEAINQLYRRTYDVYGVELPQIYKKPPTDTLPRGTFLNMIDDKNSLVLVAERKSVIVGVLCAEIESEDGDKWFKPRRWLSINELSVSDEYDSDKTKESLLKETEKWATKQKVCELTTMIYSYEKPEINLFQQNGYKTISVRVTKRIGI